MTSVVFRLWRLAAPGRHAGGVLARRAAVESSGSRSFTPSSSFLIFILCLREVHRVGEMMASDVPQQGGSAV